MDSVILTLAILNQESLHKTIISHAIQIHYFQTFLNNITKKMNV